MRSIQTDGGRGEAYEAALRRARVLDQSGAPGVVEAYLDAHALDPRRAEPLHALALRWQRSGDHALAYLVARRAAELPAPSGEAAVDEEVYAWRVADLTATSALHLRDVEPTALWVGLECALRAFDARPEDPRLAENLERYRAFIPSGTPESPEGSGPSGPLGPPRSARWASSVPRESRGGSA